MKLFGPCLLFIVFSLSAQSTGLTETSEYIFSHSQTIINAISRCDSIKMQLVGYDCDDTSIKDQVISLLEKKDIVNNEIEATKTINAYFRCLTWVSLVLTSSPIISDSINIRFLIKLLQAKKDKKPHPLAFIAYNLLSERSAISALVLNKEALKHAVAVSNDRTFEKLLVLIAQTKEEKESLLKKIQARECRARLGDTAALQVMIKHYKLENEFEMKRIKADWLVYTQQVEAIAELMKDFNNPLSRIDFAPQPPCTLQTIRMAIMASFTKYFPTEKLFTVELRNLDMKRELLNDSSYTNSLVSRFAKIVNDNYNVAVPISPEKYPLGQPCIYFMNDNYRKPVNNTRDHKRHL